jgi:tRNA(Arg) A34 adenosine deaminase TadA
LKESAMNRRDFLGVSGLAFAAGRTCAGEAKATGSNEVTSLDPAGIGDQDLEHLDLAIQLSDLSSSRRYGENHPFGAVIVLKDGTVIRGHNHVHTLKDPTQHAELYTVSKACRSGLGARHFEGGTLYTSTEPCAMCCGAIYWAGIRRVVYGCSHDRLDELFREMFPRSTEGGGLLMSSREVFAKGGARTDVLGPFLEDRAVAVHRKHWPSLLGLPFPAGWQPVR